VNDVTSAGSPKRFSSFKETMLVADNGQIEDENPYRFGVHRHDRFPGPRWQQLLRPR
jgi:hypothetical protein